MYGANGKSEETSVKERKERVVKKKKKAGPNQKIKEKKKATLKKIYTACNSLTFNRGISLQAKIRQEGSTRNTTQKFSSLRIPFSTTKEQRTEKEKKETKERRKKKEKMRKRKKKKKKKKNTKNNDNNNNNSTNNKWKWIPAHQLHRFMSIIS